MRHSRHWALSGCVTEVSHVVPQVSTRHLCDGRVSYSSTGATQGTRSRPSQNKTKTQVRALVTEESQRVKMHRNADIFLAPDAAHPMLAHHAVAPPLFPPAPPPLHGLVVGGGQPGRGGGGAGGNGLPWVPFDVELGQKLKLPVISAAGEAARVGVAAGGGEGGSPLKKRQIKPRA